ncbi:MAG: redoxin domain-containing protein, partial [candidate division NC10 bacterium]|nr:redoxin domain-containing protein [candidate division NC10 bacterium]
DAEIIGVSANHTLSQQAFADRLKLPFPLLSDFPQREIMKKYDVLVTEGILAGLAKRSYFIIDKNGILRWKKILENPRELVPNEDLLAALQKIQ